MNVYLADAGSDWGTIYHGRQIKASTIGAAIGAAGRMAQKECRRRPKQIHVKVTFVGNEQRLHNKAEAEN